ncbi:hypothetical protein [Thermoflexus hugenholtzii]
MRLSHAYRFGFIITLSGWVLACAQPMVSPTPMPTPIQTPTPMPTPTYTAVPTPTATSTPKPTPTEEATPTPILTVKLEEYSLLRKKDLENAKWEWDKGKNGGTFTNLNKGTKIYMPFNGYVESFINFAFNGAQEVWIFNPDKSIKIQILGFFEITPEVRTPGTLIRKGQVLGVFTKDPPKNNMWGQSRPFLIIYAYYHENLSPWLLKTLFPDIN